MNVCKYYVTQLQWQWCRARANLSSSNATLEPPRGPERTTGRKPAPQFPRVRRRGFLPKEAADELPANRKEEGSEGDLDGIARKERKDPDAQDRLQPGELEQPGSPSDVNDQVSDDHAGGSAPRPAVPSSLAKYSDNEGCAEKASQVTGGWPEKPRCPKGSSGEYRESAQT